MTQAGTTLLQMSCSYLVQDLSFMFTMHIHDRTVIDLGIQKSLFVIVHVILFIISVHIVSITRVRFLIRVLNSK